MGGLLMDLCCEHCAKPIIDNGAGEWLHAHSLEPSCANGINVATYKLEPSHIRQTPDRLGCPRCGSFDLTIGLVAFETVEFYSDGRYDCPGDMSYGRAFAVCCLDCNWKMGEEEPDEVDLEKFPLVHQAAIREEMLREMRSS
jgi:hypothetical protein